MSDVTLLSDRSFRAWKSLKMGLRAFFYRFKPGHKGLCVEHLSDHLVRDIGLTPADVEHHRFRFPSQTEHHPRG